MVATHAVDIEFTTVYMNVFKSDRSFMGWAGEKCAQPPASSTWGSFLRRVAEYSSWTIKSFCQSMPRRRHQCRWSPWPVVNDQNHISYLPFIDIQFNFRRFVNKMMLKIQERWTINVVEYIPEMIRSLDSYKFIIQKIVRHCVFKVRQYTCI
jgi:hypothetical protein